MNYKGTIIEESLSDPDILKELNIVSAKVELVTERHKTPWLSQWTLHDVEILESKAEEIAEKIKKALDLKYWYADFKNDRYHFIIFGEKIFRVDLSNPVLYLEARQYGVSLGIPGYQLDFELNERR